MNPTNPQAKAVRLQTELALFTGGDQRYRHPLNGRVLYTPGVRHLAEEASAYWLVDAIASWIGSRSFNDAIAGDWRLESLQFWRLAVDLADASAVLTARADSDEPAFIMQRVPFTDFPLAQIDVWCGWDGRDWTLYLPSEH